MISKDGRLKDLGGSGRADWVYFFELEIQNLEEYFYAEIPFDKKDIAKFKSVLGCTTPELLAMVDENQKIIYEEGKKWCDHFPSFDFTIRDLKALGIDCEVEIRTRSIQK